MRRLLLIVGLLVALVGAGVGRSTARIAQMRVPGTVIVDCVQVLGQPCSPGIRFYDPVPAGIESFEVVESMNSVITYTVALTDTTFISIGNDGAGTYVLPSQVYTNTPGGRITVSAILTDESKIEGSFFIIIFEEPSGEPNGIVDFKVDNVNLGTPQLRGASGGLLTTSVVNAGSYVEAKDALLGETVGSHRLSTVPEGTLVRLYARDTNGRLVWGWALMPKVYRTSVPLIVH